MLIDTLDKYAERYIPAGIHELLHIDSRVAWVETVADLVERGSVKASKENIKALALSWENLLFKRYSSLN